MRWFTSDFHFGHEHVRQACNRPFVNTARMDKHLIRNYNKVVETNDVVYILGDLALVGPAGKSWLAERVSRLKGRKRLILGNHDTLSAWDYIDMGFEEVHTNCKLKIADKVVPIVHDPAVASVLPDLTVFLCGHVHTLWNVLTFSNTGSTAINVGVDVNRYSPISEDEIQRLVLEHV